MNKISIVNDEVFCPKCQKYKQILEFYSFNGAIKRPCRQCKLEYQEKYYISNKIHIEIYKSNYYQTNKDRVLLKQQIRDNKRKNEIRAYQVKYRHKNKNILRNKRKIYLRNKLQSKPIYRLRRILSNSVYQALKYSCNSKCGSSILKYLPYTINELKDHLEKQFESWMTWKNWGIYNASAWNDNDKSTWTWNIDHIVPQSKLLYDSMQNENFRKCWALENLRPLSAKENILKGNRKQ